VRILLVDDDPGLRTLLRTTFEIADIEVDEAEDSLAARRRIARRRPDVVVLDIHMPGLLGDELCRRLKGDPRTAAIPVILLTGSGDGHDTGADAVIRKPFSPLELLGIVERLHGGEQLATAVPARGRREADELILYARDLRLLLELERSQRQALQAAYLETVAALASALETKDTRTRAHSQRVQQYAVALARRIDPGLAAEPTTQYGFLLHDVGKIGIPDSILLKPGPLTPAERRRMETHTVLGEQMLGGVAFLQGEGLRIVRSHHERWDGRGYPDRLRGDEIPLGARIFAVADTLDAMTSNRPYRRSLRWDVAREEIARQSGRQFDADVVAAFLEQDGELRAVRRGLEPVTVLHALTGG
jgi:response regulator RpfG family c-di-GMP phosphodiesterase